MAKLIKKKKRRLRFEVKAFLIFLLSIVLYLVVNIVVGSKNIRLTMNIQECKDKIKEYETQNDLLKTEIVSLKNKDTIYEIAQEKGLTQNKDNIILIKKID